MKGKKGRPSKKEAKSVKPSKSDNKVEVVSMIEPPIEGTIKQVLPIDIEEDSGDKVGLTSLVDGKLSNKIAVFGEPTSLFIALISKMTKEFSWSYAVYRDPDDIDFVSLGLFVDLVGNLHLVNKSKETGIPFITKLTKDTEGVTGGIVAQATHVSFEENVLGFIHQFLSKR